MIGLWWASFLAANLLFLSAPEIATPEAAISARRTSVVGAVAGLLATVLAIAIVRDLSRRQEALAPVIPQRPDAAPTWRPPPAPPG